MATKRWLTYEERKRIEQMYAAGVTVNEIAQSMEKHPTTIYKELHKGTTGQMDENGRLGYSAKLAQEHTLKNRYGDQLVAAGSSEE